MGRAKCKVWIKVTFGLCYLWFHPKRDLQAPRPKVTLIHTLYIYIYIYIFNNIEESTDCSINFHTSSVLYIPIATPPPFL